jgi:integrase
MHYHIPKPFYRKSRKTWYVEISGRQINLGPEKEAAFQRYYEIMACPPEKRLESVQKGPGTKLCQLFDSFLDWLQKNRSAATYGWYQYRLQRFADHYPDLTIEQLKPFHVQEWVDGYEDHATTTRRNYIRTVKRCLKWAKRQGYIGEDPIALMEVPAGEARDVFIPRDKFDELLTLAPDPSLRDLMKVTYATGCRPQESLRLEIRHVDLKHQRWVIPRTEAKGKKAPRVVYLSEESVRITEHLIAGRADGFVFRNSQGKKWTVSAVNCAFKRIRDRLGIKEMDRLKIQIPESEIEAEEKKVKKTRCRAGVVLTKTKSEIRCEAKSKVRKRLAQSYAPKYSLYALRHSWATNALQSGVDSLTVAILMGHQDPSMLAKVYQHLSHNPAHLLEQARRAANAVAPNKPTE